jgi:hypothetical protein
MLDATARTLQYALGGLTMRQTPTDVESPRGATAQTNRQSLVNVRS